MAGEINLRRYYKLKRCHEHIKFGPRDEENYLITLLVYFVILQKSKESFFALYLQNLKN